MCIILQCLGYKCLYVDVCYTRRILNMACTLYILVKKNSIAYLSFKHFAIRLLF